MLQPRAPDASLGRGGQPLLPEGRETLSRDGRRCDGSLVCHAHDLLGGRNAVAPHVRSAVAKNGEPRSLKIPVPPLVAACLFLRLLVEVVSIAFDEDKRAMPRQVARNRFGGITRLESCVAILRAEH